MAPPQITPPPPGARYLGKEEELKDQRNKVIPPPPAGAKFVGRMVASEPEKIAPPETTRQPLQWQYKGQESVFEKPHPLQGPVSVAQGAVSGFVEGAVGGTAKLARNAFIAAQNIEAPEWKKSGNWITDTIFAPLREGYNLASGAGKDTGGLIEAPPAQGFPGLGQSEHVPGWGVGQGLSEAGGHFAGFMAGVPGKVTHLVGSAANSYIFKKLAPAWGPVAAEAVARLASQSAGLSVGMGVSQGDLDTMTDRLVSGAVLGPIFGATNMFDFSKLSPLINTMIRQVGARAMAKVVGQYDPKLLGDIVSGSPEEIAQSGFDELLFGWFSKGPQGRKGRAKAELARIKDEVVKSGLRVEVRPEVEDAILKYSEMEAPVYGEGGAVLTMPTVDTAFPKIAIPKQPEAPFNRGLSGGSRAQKVGGETFEAVGAPVEGAVAAEAAKPAKKPLPYNYEALKQQATPRPESAEAGRTEAELPRELTHIKTQQERAKEEFDQSFIRAMRKEPWELSSQEQAMLKSIGAKAEGGPEGESSGGRRSVKLYAGLHPDMAKEFFQAWGRHLVKQGLLKPGEERIYYDKLRELAPDGVDFGMSNMYSSSPWGKAVKKGITLRAEINALIKGEKFDATLLPENLRNGIKEKGGEALWEYAGKSGIIGGATKPVMAVASSPINCRPSRDCSDFCYAYTGRGQMPNVLLKAEIIDHLAQENPKRLGGMIADEFGKSALAREGKALRFFDRGEGAEWWGDVIGEVNSRGIRAHVFSKRPEFLSKVDPQNVRLLSIDKSNADIAEGNDLPIALNYTDKSMLPLVEKYRGRIQVVLPVRGVATPEDIAALPNWTKRYQCPVDAGKKTINEKYGKREEGKWNCPDCDAGKGIGCYADHPTKAPEAPKGGAKVVGKVGDEAIEFFKDHAHLSRSYWSKRGGFDAEVKFWADQYPDMMAQAVKSGRKWEGVAEDIQTNAANNFFEQAQNKFGISPKEALDLLEKVGRGEKPSPSSGEGVKVYSGLHPDMAKKFFQKWGEHLEKEGLLRSQEPAANATYFRDQVQKEAAPILTRKSAKEPRSLDMPDVVSKLRKTSPALAEAANNYEFKRLSLGPGMAYEVSKVAPALLEGSPEYKTAKAERLFVTMGKRNEMAGKRLHDIIEKGEKPANEAEQAAVDLVRRYLSDTGDRAVANGVKLLSPFHGHTHPFKKLENYLPRVWTGIESLIDGEIFKTSGERMIRELAATSPELKADYANPATRDKAIARAEALWNLFRRDAKTRRYSHLEYDRVLTDEMVAKLKAEWEAKNPDKEFPLKRDYSMGGIYRYLVQANDRLSWLEEFGEDVIISPGKGYYPRKAWEAIESAKDDKTQEYIRKTFERILRSAPSTTFEKAVDAYRTIQVGKMMFSAIPNSGQWLITTAVDQPVEVSARAFLDAFVYAGAKGKEKAEAMRTFLHSTGSMRMKQDIVEAMSRDSSGQLLRKLADGGLMINMFNGTEWWNRFFAGLSGPQLAKEMSQRLYEGASGESSWKARRAPWYIAELKRLGVKEELIERAKRGEGPITENELVDLGRAAFNMSLTTQFIQSVFYQPLSWSSRLGKTATQFKQFGFRFTSFLWNEPIKEFGRFAKSFATTDTSKWASEGDVGKIMRAAVILPAVSSLVYEARKKVYGMLGIPFYEAVLAGKSWPMAVLVRAWQAGGIGLASDILIGMQRGTTGLVGVFGGPTAADLATILTATATTTMDLYKGFVKYNPQWLKQRSKKIGMEWARVAGKVSPLARTALSNFWGEYQKVQTFTQWSSLIRDAFAQYKEIYVLKSPREAEEFWESMMNTIGKEYQELTGRKLTKLSEKEIMSWWEEMGKPESERVPMPGSSKSRKGRAQWAW